MFCQSPFHDVVFSLFSVCFLSGSLSPMDSASHTSYKEVLELLRKGEGVSPSCCPPCSLPCYSFADHSSKALLDTSSDYNNLRSGCNVIHAVLWPFFSKTNHESSVKGSIWCKYWLVERFDGPWYTGWLESTLVPESAYVHTAAPLGVLNQSQFS